ncbi:hypothetical protein QR680_001218 [Steinernema hermaphroditum]|uniref:Calcineurin-like phosphoesterase domain-containing protein n=1 Tax=Steinernema hermaphroditum TaxID=289476 RepID=A0AA39H057_9BILA|nr:hypothetical protein QR680_001218 [Steinernema hermaphroditum]
MLNHSLARRNTLRDRSHHESRRPTLAVIFDSTEDDTSTKIDNATLLLTTEHHERSRSASGRRKSAPNLEIGDEEDRRRLEMQHQAALDLDFFVTNNNEAFVLLPAVGSKANKMMLSNALENFARTQSVKNGSPNGKQSPRRTSVVGGVFDISPRNSMGDIKKLRKESMLPQQTSRKDSGDVELQTTWPLLGCSSDSARFNGTMLSSEGSFDDSTDYGSGGTLSVDSSLGSNFGYDRRESLSPAPSSSKSVRKLRFYGSATVLQKSFRLELSKPKPVRDRRSNSVIEHIPTSFEIKRRESIINAGNDGDSIRAHQYTEDPTVAWEMLKVKRPVKLVRQMKQSTPIRPDHVRFVCVACTHGAVLDPSQIPLGDVLLIAGDFTSCGLPKEVKAFNENLGHLKHPFKIVIGGNHECTFDDAFLKSSGKDSGEAKELALKHALLAALNSSKVSSPKTLLTNGIYLQDSMIELFGLRIYGTPWQPRMDNWAFNLERGQPLLDKWNQIPVGVDVLLTHTPPLGHGDLLLTGMRAGCVELLNSVTKRIRPKYHVFGHIHEGYGCTSDGYTKFINCCLTNHRLEVVNSPVIFDIPVNPDTKALYIQNCKKILKKLKK